MITPAWEEGQLYYCDKDLQRIDELKAPEGLVVLTIEEICDWQVTT